MNSFMLLSQYVIPLQTLYLPLSSSYTPFYQSISNFIIRRYDFSFRSQLLPWNLIWPRSMFARRIYRRACISFWFISYSQNPSWWDPGMLVSGKNIILTAWIVRINYFLTSIVSFWLRAVLLQVAVSLSDLSKFSFIFGVHLISVCLWLTSISAIGLCSFRSFLIIFFLPKLIPYGLRRHNGKSVRQLPIDILHSLTLARTRFHLHSYLELDVLSVCISSLNCQCVMTRRVFFIGSVLRELRCWNNERSECRISIVLFAVHFEDRIP